MKKNEKHNANWSIETMAIRSHECTSDAGEHSPAVMLTSSYLFDSAEHAADVFAERQEGFSYSRFANPTVDQFEQRLNELEGGKRTIAASTGMGAIISMAMTMLEAGDHVVCARNCFGSTLVLFNQILKRYGVETTLVEVKDLDEWRAAITPKTKLFFFESPTNPMLEIADIEAITNLAHEHDIKVVVDNCFATPCLQRPILYGADIVVHSATKYMDGQGRVLGGAIVCAHQEDGDAIHRILRTIGTSMGAFEAWVLLKSLETLPVRMRAHCENALAIAQWLEQQQNVERVYYPGLVSHPQHELASRYLHGGFGGIIAFDVCGGQQGAWKLIDHCDWISRSGNLGDTRTIITHPYTTTHGRVSSEDKALLGIKPQTIRLSVGLEGINDIRAALAQGLASI